MFAANESLPTYPSREWSFASRLAAVTLILFFVLVPVSDAFADTSETSVEMSAPEAEIMIETPPEETSSSIEESVEVSPSESAVTAGVPVSDSEPAPELAVSSDSVVESVPDQSEDVGASSDAETTEAVISVPETAPIPVNTEMPTDLATSTDTSSAEEDTSAVEQSVSSSTSTEPVQDVVPQLPEVVPHTEVPATTTSEQTDLEVIAATTTPEVVAPLPDVLPETSTHMTDADRFTFGVSECVPVGNGAFHCVRTDEQAVEGEVTEPLYAAKDTDGDMEIFVNDGATQRQLTQNDYDDDAPTQDTVTGDIVWQAQIDDRYQVMHYDTKSGATTRITKEAYNSMQPSINDGDIVFQAWIGDDWEIVLIDDVDGREILTDNTEQDITPSITSDFIMWQAMEGGEWVGKVYDRATKEIETVRGIAGGKVENPRMIMVFDSTKDNGDTETIGYDPVSGEVVSLAVTPLPVVPENIPDPEPQQEEKALVQPTTTTRTETKNASTSDDGVTNGEPEDVVATSTPPVVPENIEIAPTTPSAATGTDMTLDLSAPGHSFSAPLIPDLVIPAFNASSDATTSPSV